MKWYTLFGAQFLSLLLVTGCENSQQADDRNSTDQGQIGELSRSLSSGGTGSISTSSEQSVSSSISSFVPSSNSTSSTVQSVAVDTSSLPTSERDSSSVSSAASSDAPSGNGTATTSSYHSTVSSASAASIPTGDVYAQWIEPKVVQATCVNCHAVGLRSGMTRLVFTKGEEKASQNRQIFADFVAEVPAGRKLILNKVRGSAHGGGAVLPASTDEYGLLEQFLSEITGGTEDTVEPQTDYTASGFQKLRLESEADTLRRASILFSGRVPSEEELAAVEGDKSILREAIGDSMQGDAFHSFLLRSVNDRLLTDAFFSGKPLDVMDPSGFAYPLLADRRVLAAEQGGIIEEEYGDWRQRLKYGVIRAPLELIAYIVENDRPYTEVLTADYTMVNPFSAEIYNANMTFDDPTDVNEFRRAKNRGQIIRDEYYDGEFVSGLGTVIYSHNEFLDYPHAGVLNEPAFLNRYPSTETNRNRARARWTFYHFLDVDIEKSSERTNDPEALADTDNPTMNNKHCTVCHEIMDPVAGAFQNYGDFGWYRDSRDGMDALPLAYKRAEDSGYKNGDLWYGDMRAPGFEQKRLNDNDNDQSLRWLAQQITEDERFARATVKFWWPAVMSEAPLEAPESSEDFHYADQFKGFEAQQAVITELAAGFRNGFEGGEAYNLKDLLVAMTLTDWFRASSASEVLTVAEKTQLAGVGKKRLLTPEELEAKTRSLLGLAWGEEFDVSWVLDGHRTMLQDSMHIYYGGIDSNGITQRADALNSVMSNVAMAQASALACPSVLLDFNRSPDDRLLFKHVDRYMTPAVREREQFTVRGSTDDNQTFRRMSASLDQGEHVLRLSFDNPYWDSELRQRLLLVIHTIRVKTSSGNALVAFDGQDLMDYEGAVSLDHNQDETGRIFTDADTGERTGWQLGYGYIDIPFSVPYDDEIEVMIKATRRNLVDRETLLGISILAPDGKAETGEMRIRQQLQYLHKQLLGETLSLYHEEITASYDLLLELWQERKARGFPANAIASDYENCDIPIDDWWDKDRSAELADPEHMQGAWMSMLMYFLTDYHYLHE